MRNVEPWEVWQLPGGCLLYLHSRFGQLPDAETPLTASRHTVTIIMPFGKYRGAPLNEVVEEVAYVEWLLGQRWFGEKYPRHRRYLADALCTITDGTKGPSAGVSAHYPRLGGNQGVPSDAALPSPETTSLWTKRTDHPPDRAMRSFDIRALGADAPFAPIMKPTIKP